MSYNNRWVTILAIFIIFLFILNLFPVSNRIFSTQNTQKEDNSKTINQAVIESPSLDENSVDSQTRARYFDDIINLDDPEVQLTVYSGDAGDSNYGNTYAGTQIASGDIDNDGYNDLILGTGLADGVPENIWNSGQVMVIFGRNQTYPGTIYDQAIKNTNEINLVIHGPSVSDYMGFCVASGNIDGDDYDDIIISAPYADGKAGAVRTNSGEVYVIYGSQRYNLGSEINLNNLAPDLTIYGMSTTAYTGYSLAVGNVIGDSKDDIIIGAIYGDGLNRTNCGTVHVVEGNSRGNLGTEIDLLTDSDVTLVGARDDDIAGVRVASGDINGDARDDIVISSYAIDPYGTRTNAGGAYIVYGDNTLPSLIDLNSSADSSFYGAAVSDYYGWGLAVGNVNGDEYDDMIISALWGDGYNDVLANSGDVYVKYGAPNLLSQYDLNTDGYDLTLFGKNSWDYYGYSLAAGDVNNDQYDDFLIGVYGGDGENDGKANSGETYLILGNSTANLGSNLDPLADAESVFYGIDNDDYSGRTVHLGDFDSDGYDDVSIYAPYADGPDNGRDIVGEFYTIFSRPPPIKNEFVKLIDGDFDNRTIFSKYKEYTFRVNISNILGYKDCKWVVFTIDPDGYNLTTRWTRVGLQFTELNDPNNLVKCVSTGSDSDHDNNYNYSIDFKMIFNWTFSKTDLIDCKITSMGERSLRREKIVADVFKVNNKLTYIGDLKVSGKIQGDLMEDDWVRGDEKLTFNGLTVVYNDTQNYYPPITEYSIGIEDETGITEFEPTGVGEEVNVKINTPLKTTDYNYKLLILGLPVGCDCSSNSFRIKVDSDPPGAPDWIAFKANSIADTGVVVVDNDSDFVIFWSNVEDVGSGTVGYYYSLMNNSGTENGIWTTTDSGIIQNASEGSHTVYVWAKDAVGNIGSATNDKMFIDLTEVSFENFQPKRKGWFTTKNITCSIQINDLNGFGVDADQIWYWNTMENKWIKVSESELKSTDSTSYTVTVIATMNEGTDNYIKFQVTDLAENGPTLSQSFYFNIDSVPITFKDASPTIKKKLSSPVVKCYVTIEDLEGSGVNHSTIQYSYSTKGLGNFSQWTNADLAMISNPSSVDTSQSSKWFVELKFKRGINNYIRWRANDIAGNEYKISEAYNININKLPMVSIKKLEADTKFDSKIEIEFNAESTIDIDDTLHDSSFTWRSNITGMIGSGKVLKTRLPVGNHHITLTVFDGQSNASKGLNITISEPKKPSSTTDQGIFGLDKNASFMLIILIIVIIIIILLFLVVYTHERKKRRILEEKALGSKTTYIPARSPGLAPGGAAGPQLYDATVSPTGIATVSSMEQLPTTISTAPTGTTATQVQPMQQLPSIGGTVPTVAPTPTATPTPTVQPSAAPGTAPIPTAATQASPEPQPQLPPAVIQTGPQPSEPEVTTTQPVFGESLKTDEGASSEEEPELLEPLGPEDTTPVQEPLTPPEEPEEELPLGLTPDSPEFLKRVKKEEEKKS